VWLTPGEAPNLSSSPSSPSSPMHYHAATASSCVLRSMQAVLQLFAEDEA